MHHLHLNPVAVLVTAIMQWLIGAIWYSLLFAKPWNAMVAVRQEGKGKTMITGMIASLVGDILVSLAMAHMILWSGASTVQWGIIIGLICWLGFIVAPMLPQNIYEGRPFKLFAINSGFWLVALVLTGVILAIWH
jgi:hypothetical protein